MWEVAMKWLAVALWLLCGSVQAQQEFSVRPAKGGMLTLISGEPLASATSTTSEAYDWTAFSAVQVILSSGSACAFKPVMTVLGAPNVEGSPIDFAAQTNENGTYTYDDTGSTTVHYTVGNMLPWIKFRLTAVAGTGSAGCAATVIVVPVPFDPSVTGTIRMDSTGTSTSTLESDTVNTSISNATATSLVAAASSGRRRVIWVQNTGTVALYCKLGASATSSDYHAVLKAGIANDDGGGGFWSAADWAGIVSCIAASGTGRASAGSY